MISIGVAIGLTGLILLAFRVDRGTDLLIAFCVVPIVTFPLISSLVAIRDRRRAAILLLVAAPGVGACVSAGLGLRLWLAHNVVWSDILIALALVMLVPAVLGSFWFITHRLGWQPIIQARSLSLGRKIAAISLGSLMLILFVWVGVFALAVRAYFIGDCSGYDPTFVHPESGDQAVFIGKIIYVGNTVDRSGHKLGGWAVALVEHEFWGLSGWNHRYVVLTQGIFEDGQEYFVSGRRRDGLLTRNLIVEVDLCRRPARLNDAEVELRVLRDGPPKDGVRIIGRVVRFLPDYRIEGVPGINVVITGPAGSIATTTDQHGVYDVSSLPPGRYSVRADSYNSQGNPSCGLHGENPRLAAGDVWGCTIYP